MDLLSVIISEGKGGKKGVIQPLFLVTSPLIHVVLLLVLTHVSTRPAVKDFGFSQERRTGHEGCMCHVRYSLSNIMSNIYAAKLLLYLTTTDHKCRHSTTIRAYIQN